MSTPTRETLAARRKRQKMTEIVITNTREFGLRESADFLENHADECDPAYLAAVAESMRQAADALAATCAWTLDDFDGWWNTACGRAHEFTTGGPVDNAQPFCGYCGGRLVVTAHPGADTGTEREG